MLLFPEAKIKSLSASTSNHEIQPEPTAPHWSWHCQDDGEASGQMQKHQRDGACSGWVDVVHREIVRVPESRDRAAGSVCGDEKSLEVLGSLQGKQGITRKGFFYPTAPACKNLGAHLGKCELSLFHKMLQPMAAGLRTYLQSCKHEGLAVQPVKCPSRWVKLSYSLKNNLDGPKLLPTR